MKKPDCLKCRYFSETAEHGECDECMWNPIASDHFESIKKYELFQDSSYYDMWCVRSMHDTRFNSPMSFHFETKIEADTFMRLLEAAK